MVRLVGITFLVITDTVSPAVLGNLWDVTDKDIDRFTTRLFETWGLVESASTTTLTYDSDNEDRSDCTLTEATAIARDSCLLPYLVGASPVVYGIPVHFA